MAKETPLQLRGAAPTLRRTRSSSRESSQPLSQPKPSAKISRQPSKLRRSYRAQISDSEDDGDTFTPDEILTNADQDIPSHSRSATMKEVSVPPPSFKLPLKPRTAGDSTSLASSVNGSMIDLSSDYETPDTSTAVTPVESASRTVSASTVATDISSYDRGRKPRVNATARAQELRESALALSTSSRKRNLDIFNRDADDDNSPDTLFARRLQAKEYDQFDPKRAKITYSNSDEESEDCKEPIIIDSDRDNSELFYMKTRPKQNRNTSIRGESSNNAGNNIINNRKSYIIPDSDDESLVSALPEQDPDPEADVDEDDWFGDVQDIGSSETSGVDSDTGDGVFNQHSISTRVRRPWIGGRARKERIKLEMSHPSIKTMWDDLKLVPIIAPVKAAQPTSITRKLKPFQLEGLNWMMEQEKSQWKGGLLGDEMGMGKTIQAVSLIMSDHPAEDPTLVVVPPVALMQWQSEINDYTNGKLSVLVYHNSNTKVKTLKTEDLKKYDVIMISYNSLEVLHRKESKGRKVEGGIVKQDSIIHTLHFHRLILDEAHSIKVSVTVTGRSWANKTSRMGQTRTTGVAKACFALQANYKWCLSGTPVQNRIGEFFSLLRFLEVRPFACYFCKSCSCAEMHWSQDANRMCTHCHHRGFEHVSVFNQELLNPITSGDNPEVRKEALGKLRLITDRIMLRRMKKDHTASMELPPKEVIIHNEFFGEIERDFSTSIMTNTARQFDTYVSRGVMLNNYANIFGLIMQMRQVANHPDLLLKRKAEGGQNILVCCICDEAAEEAIRSRCRHEFCRKCARDYVKSFEGNGGGDPDCPRCHIPLSIDFDQPDIEQEEDNVKKNSIINRIKMEDWTSSTKIEMLVYDLYKLRSKKQTQKSIIFSQFTSMLQLIEWRLRRAGFNTVMLDGSMSPAQRQKSIEYFMNNVNVEVFLVSLKAGGVALNLTEASRVFIVDPWWNPAAEWQSADRCHRIGQKRPCVITRLCIEDSVESRMVMLQEKKANMINGTINNDQVAIDKLTPDDMQFLFRGT